jgi:hypothetical protein
MVGAVDYKGLLGAAIKNNENSGHSQFDSKIFKGFIICAAS